MEKKEISEYKYNQLNQRTKYEYPEIDATALKMIHKYLKDKKTVVGGNDNNDIAGQFLTTMLYRCQFSPKFTEAVEEFIQSEYLSDCFIENIMALANELDYSEKLNKIFIFDPEIKKMSCSELEVIDKCISDYYSDKERANKQDYNLAHNSFRQYLFCLNGKGPTEFIKKNYSDKELAHDILFNSGIIPSIDHYKDSGVSIMNLGDEHLFSVYKKICKFYPDAKEEFEKLVDMIPTLTPVQFIYYFQKFAENGYSTVNLNVDMSEILNGENLESNRAVNPDEMDKKLSDYIKKQFSQRLSELNNISAYGSHK